MERKDQKPQQTVQFNHSTGIAIAGVIGGVAIALGLPYILLRYARVEGPFAETPIPYEWQRWLIVGAVGLGGLIAITAVFFGLVMPTSVNEMWDESYSKDRPNDAS